MLILQASVHAILLCGVVGLKGHAVLTPNYGARSGNNFSTVLFLPGAYDDVWSSRIVITIPDGVRAITPEPKRGWRTFAGLGRITFVADEYQSKDRAADLRLNFSLSMMLGCRFENASDDMFWQGQYTLWWRTAQYFSPVGSLQIDETRTIHWALVPESSDALWSAARPSGGIGPCPYTFISSDSACLTDVGREDNTSAQHLVSGMWWLDSVVSPSPPVVADLDPAHIVSRIVQRDLDKEGILENLLMQTRLKSRPGGVRGHAATNHGRVGRHHKHDFVMDEDGDLTDDATTNQKLNEAPKNLSRTFFPSSSHKRMVAKVVAGTLCLLPVIVLIAFGLQRLASHVSAIRFSRKFRSELLSEPVRDHPQHDPIENQPTFVSHSGRQEESASSCGVCTSSGSNDSDDHSLVHDVVDCKSNADRQPPVEPLVLGAPCHHGAHHVDS